MIEIRRKARENGTSIENEMNSTGPGGTHQSRSHNLVSKTAASRSMAERRIDEELLTQKYMKTYNQLEGISSKLAMECSSDKFALMSEYVQLAYPLVEGFRQTPALFPCTLVGLLTQMSSELLSSVSYESSVNLRRNLFQSSI